MGIKRAFLNRAFFNCDKVDLNITKMDGNNDPNDGERKHTDFSIDKILSDETPKPTTQTVERIPPQTNEYNYWNRRIYPPPRLFLPPTINQPINTQSEIVNLSLRMYGHGQQMTSMSSQQYASHQYYGGVNYASSINKFDYYRNLYSFNQNVKFFGLDLNLNHRIEPINKLPVKSEPTITSNSDLACSVCNKVFENTQILEMHERTHKSPKYTCEECGKGFSQLRNFKYHVSVHKGTKEFAAKCPECDKLFNDKGYLSSHLKIHRNKKEYVCPHCPKSFNQRVAFNMHARIHSGIKPHKCAECGKCFSRKMLLKQHLRTHSGEKPYQCSICLKTFADRSNMTLHQRLHSGIKPFVCTMCPKAFTKKHHLKTHLNYHIGCKPYICPHPNCGKSFTQSSNMRTHSRKCEFRPPDNQQPQRQAQTQTQTQPPQQ